jgi:hypothetical protein
LPAYSGRLVVSRWIPAFAGMTRADEALIPHFASSGLLRCRSQ